MPNADIMFRSQSNFPYKALESEEDSEDLGNFDDLDNPISDTSYSEES
jgi:hypothetical protein